MHVDAIVALVSVAVHHLVLAEHSEASAADLALKPIKEKKN